MFFDHIEKKYFEDSDGNKYRKWIEKTSNGWKILWIEGGIKKQTKNIFSSKLVAIEELMYGVGREIVADIYINSKCNC